MNIIAIANQKGGVGKTTTAVNLSACLARAGRSTLLIDLDPQCNATEHVGFEDKRDESESSYALIAEKEPDFEKIIVPLGPNWQLVPSHIAMAEIDIKLFSTMNRETRLARALARLEDNYDYVIMDCAPSLSISTVNALSAATQAIIAIQTNWFAYEAVKRLMLVAKEVVEATNPDLEVYALATMHRGNVNIHRDVLTQIQSDFQDYCFNTIIPYTATLVEASVAKQAIVDYAHGSKGHQHYEQLTKEIIKRVERQEYEAQAEVSN